MLSNDPHAADRYKVIVYWSDEDQVFIGECPELFLGGMTHGDDPLEVFKMVRELVAEEVQERIAKGEPFPVS